MQPINFTGAEKNALVEKIQDYFAANLDTELEQFDAEFLLEFFSKQLGVFYYNRGLLDAQNILRSRVDEISEAITLLERIAGE